MTRKLLVGVIAAGALAVTAGTAFALTGDDDDATTRAATGTTTSLTAPSSDDDDPTSSGSPTASSTGTSSQAPDDGMTAEEAANIVRQRYGGTVREVEHEVEHGRQEWKVEIAAADGKTYDVRVDAKTGDVTRVDQDDDDRHGDDDD